MFYKQAKVFSQSHPTARKEIIAAGEKALVALYGGANEEGLDSLRYRQFCDKITKSTSPVEPQTLPPTSVAAKYHSLCVYYQMMEWKGESLNMKPKDWGWHIVDGRCMPLQIDQPAAPLELLDVICCSCSKELCNTKKCTCRKHGLGCTAVCR